MSKSLEILCVATKVPWPAVDGGRLVLSETLRCLGEQGIEVTLVAPSRETDPGVSTLELPCRLVSVPSKPVSRGLALLKSLFGGPPLALGRHRHKKIDQRVAQLIATGRFDLLWVEQLQAVGDVFRHGCPVVLRQQNVESTLWRQLAKASRFPLRYLASRESRRLADAECRAIRSSALTLALSAEDAFELSSLSGTSEKVQFLAPAFPSQLEPGEEVEGDPALVIAGSRGWWPNERGLQWFLEEIWPVIARELASAVLHIYGLGQGNKGPRLIWHPPPESSREAFPANGILLVPLLHGSGIRIKILEAWSRGVPVVATPEAAAGLSAIHGESLLLASTARAFLEALRDLESPLRRKQMADEGHATLRREHDPDRLTNELIARLRACLSDRRISG